ncbi:EKC/KEOPS complex subunit TPRKB-like [Rhynchophorus ferrugineus]|uniref:EKC/KEOPS complex subunit TPRKB-like n=1 Tax=Rhynchophorus ferrugineus TaxID=354439 RepID=UPI003FCD7C8E
MAYMVELDPITNMVVSMQLYQNVKNTATLRKDVMSGNLECCLIKPSFIFHPFQIVIAANKTLVSKKRTTKSIYTELLFNLSLSTNITQSLQTFGVSDSDENILVVTLTPKDKQTNANSIFDRIEGDVLDIFELSCINDIQAIKKIYKINEKEYQSVDVLDSIEKVCKVFEQER